MADKNKAAIAKGLEQLLSDTFTLYLKTHNFHWNVTGPVFNMLHELFEDQYNELWEAVDEIAERIRALGFSVSASFKTFDRLTKIKIPDRAPKANDMIQQLLDGQQAVAKSAHSLAVLVEKADDVGTGDLLARRILAHDKAAWMLQSLLQR